MKKVDNNNRWTILNIPENIKKDIKDFAKANGYKIPRAIEELISKEITKWKQQQKKKP